MEIGRRTLFRTCEITWATRRFAVQGHPERGGFILVYPHHCLRCSQHLLAYLGLRPRTAIRVTELFMSHPALTRRVRAIGETGCMPAERISEVIGEMRVQGVVQG
jgi:hypothetical protein